MIHQLNRLDRRPRLCACASLAAALLLPSVARSETASIGRTTGPEWVLFMGLSTRLRGLSFTDTSVAERVAGQQFQGTMAVNYVGGSPLGVAIGGRAWLPSGLGVHATFVHESQRMDSLTETEFVETRPSYGYGSEKTTSSGTANTGPFENTNSQIHLGLGYRHRLSAHLTLGIGAGPTYFSIAQKVATAIYRAERSCTGGPTDRRCTQNLNLLESETQDNTAWGFHVGCGLVADLSRGAGLDLSLRYSRGLARLRGLEIPSAASYSTSDADNRTAFKPDLGGLTATAGLLVWF